MDRWSSCLRAGARTTRKSRCPLGFVWQRGAHVWVWVCFTVRSSCEGEMTSAVCIVSSFIFANQPQAEWTVGGSPHLRGGSHSNASRRRPRQGPIAQRGTTFATQSAQRVPPPRSERTRWDALRCLQEQWKWNCYKQIFPFPPPLR